MTREMAILGTPTISVYQDDLLEVDKFLISKELMYHEPNLTAGIVENYLKKAASGGLNNTILEKGKLAYELLKNRILIFDNPLL